jgi:hypothetical protein
MIIGLNGYAGVGKDTVGIIIQYLQCSNKGNLSIEDVIKDYKDHDWWLEDQSEWEIKKFAGKLKDIAEHLTGIPLEKFEDQEFKKTNLGPEWDCNPWGKVGTMHKEPMTVREFLQRLGADAMRIGLHDNVWVNALFADYKPVDYNDDEQPRLPNWIITDCRFPNEAQVIKDKGGIIIRVDRPGVSPINNHPSEIGLDDWKFDYKIANVSDIFALKQSVEQILKHANL